MCGRYVLATSIAGLAEAFDALYSPEVAQSYAPSWNVSPTRTVLGVAADDTGARALRPYRWGLVPSWARDLSVGGRMFNARAETVASKPSFRAAFAARRLLVPADAFYEWSKAPEDARQPYLFRRADGGPLAFAGLFERWHPGPPGGVAAPEVTTCTIVTVAAGADVADVHDRQPVVLDRDSWDTWLDRTLRDRDELEGLLRPSAPGTLVRQPVGRAVGRVGVDGAELAEPTTHP